MASPPELERALDRSGEEWEHRSARGVAYGGEAPSRKGSGALTSLVSALKLTWRMRETLWVIVVNDFKARYRAQSFGMFWAFAYPLVTMATITIAFTYVLKIPIPNYAIFYLTAAVFWHFFSSTVSAATTSLMSGASMIKRTTFPRFLIVIAPVLSHLISLGLEGILLFALYFVFPDAYQFSITLVALPLLVLLIFLQVAGIGLMTSGLNVHFRDVQYIVNSMMVVGFWVSPLLYSSSMAPPGLAPLLHINPLTGVMDGARDIVMYGRWPDPAYLIPSAIWAVVLFLAGCAVFRRLNLTTADYI